MPIQVEIIRKGSAQERAILVKNAINNLRDRMQDSILDVAEYLAEVKAGKYYQFWGCKSLHVWLREVADIDMGLRTAYYLIKIASGAKALGITKQQLQGIAVSKLKTIFTLDPETQREALLDVFARAPRMTLEEVNNEVHHIKFGPDAEPDVFLTIKVPKSVRDETILPAFEIYRRRHGGEEDRELSASRCIEFICTEYLQDKEEYGEVLASIAATKQDNLEIKKQLGVEDGHYEGERTGSDSENDRRRIEDVSPDAAEAQPANV